MLEHAHRPAILSSDARCAQRQEQAGFQNTPVVERNLAPAVQPRRESKYGVIPDREELWLED